MGLREGIIPFATSDNKNTITVSDIISLSKEYEKLRIKENKMEEQETYGEEERFQVALTITPIVLSELYKSTPIMEVIKKILPREVAVLSKLIIEELNK